MTLAVKFVMLGSVLGFSAVGFAATKSTEIKSTTPVTQEKIQKLVQQFDAVENFKVVINGPTHPRPLPPDHPDNPNPYPDPQDPPRRPPPRDCDPGDEGSTSGACVEAVCGQLGHFECNTTDKLLEITRLCRNVRGSCVTAVCSRLSSFDCDQRQELAQVTQICRGLYDTSCIDYVCSRLSRWDCDEMHELRRIADQCR